MKMKNNGFTLVELIIVVAIIAVLAAVLAPQYLQYVERSKESNDLQVATNMVRASTVAVPDPRNEIPPGYFIEVLWITGDESGGYAANGDLMVRYSSGSRLSVFNSGSSSDNVSPLPTTVSLEKFSSDLIRVMGGTPEKISTSGSGNGYISPIQDSQSKLANTFNFAFHINTATGEVALARLSSENAEGINGWIDIGIDAIPAI